MVGANQQHTLQNHYKMQTTQVGIATTIVLNRIQNCSKYAIGFKLNIGATVQV